MRRINFVIVVVASALLSIAGLASAEVLDQSLRSSNDVVHQASEQPGTLVAAETEKKTDPAPSPDVQERAVPRTGLDKAPVLPKKNTVSNLTENECKKLGCTVDVDHSCPVSNLGIERLRCYCSTGSACIDKSN